MIQPLDHGTNQVTVQAREELAEHIGHSEPKIISDQNLAILSRQLALHANVSIFSVEVFTKVFFFFFVEKNRYKRKMIYSSPQWFVRL